MIANGARTVLRINRTVSGKDYLKATRQAKRVACEVVWTRYKPSWYERELQYQRRLSDWIVSRTALDSYLDFVSFVRVLFGQPLYVWCLMLYGSAHSALHLPDNLFALNEDQTKWDKEYSVNFKAENRYTRTRHTRWHMFHVFTCYYVSKRTYVLVNYTVYLVENIKYEQ